MTACRVALLWVLMSGLARAAPSPAPVPVAGTPAVKIAILPLRDVGDGRELEKSLVEALRELPSLRLMNLVNGKLVGPRSAPLDVRADPALSARAPALASDTGAERVLIVDAAKLGDGRVLYLQAVDPSGKTPISTTVPLQNASGELSQADLPRLRAELVRVLAPSRYVGTLAVRADVSGAEVLVDGRSRGGAITELGVGTHSVRVTHPAYRDFLRFVEVDFGKVITLEANLSAYPLAEGEMQEKMRRQGKPKPVPWFRSWWFLTTCGVALAGATTGIVWSLRPGIGADQSVIYNNPPRP